MKGKRFFVFDVVPLQPIVFAKLGTLTQTCFTGLSAWILKVCKSSGCLIAPFTLVVSVKSFCISLDERSIKETEEAVAVLIVVSCSLLLLGMSSTMTLVPFSFFINPDSPGKFEFLKLPLIEVLVQFEICILLLWSDILLSTSLMH